MTSKPMAATASSRLAAVRKLPEVQSPVSWSRTAPSERGKNSYQAPRPASSRSTSSGYCSETVTSSRMGWRSTTAATSALNPAARRSSGVWDGVGEHDDGHPQRPPVGGRAGGVLGGFGEQRGAFGQHELDVDAGFHLDLGVVVPGAVAVVPGLDDEGPVAGGGRGQEAFPAVGALAAVAAGRGEADALAFLAAGVQQDGADAELVVAFAERGGAHHDGFARHGLGGELPAFDRRLHGGDRKTAKPKAVRDQGLRLLLGHGTGSRVSRHRLDVIDKSARLLRPAHVFPEVSVPAD